MADILVVDDEADIRELISDILQDEGYSTRSVGTAHEAIEQVGQVSPALMILDIWLKDSDMDGIDILKVVKRDYPQIPIVIISGHGNIEIAVAAIKQGAYDFIEKPFNIDQLLVVVKRAMETSQLRSENQTLKNRSSDTAQIVGKSTAFKTFKSQLDKVTKSNGRVLLRGPSGCGKELAAKYIHGHGNRSTAPFVSLNCATLDPETLDRVLLGYVENGRLHSGLFAQADGGIIFLDEVADLPLLSQSRLLRVLIDQKFTPVGHSEEIKVDVRVISATSRDLEAMIQDRMFREELYHRLNVVPISVPALEDRRDDIPVLAEHFIGVLHAEQGLPKRQLNTECAATLESMAWPGNIRELRNLVERILILGPKDGDIDTTEIPTEVEVASNSESRMILSNAMASLSLREARELFEREYLLNQINRFGGNISRTASFVGMERSALHRKLKSLGIITSARAGSRLTQIEGTEDA